MTFSGAGKVKYRLFFDFSSCLGFTLLGVILYLSMMYLMRDFSRWCDQSEIFTKPDNWGTRNAVWKGLMPLSLAPERRECLRSAGGPAWLPRPAAG
ncbi:hypothetical protein IE979_13605 [Klebsiella pneumoniae]|uniref:Uncharacterized protein n=1 Tax=Klebsiella pneumoniae TaxID=573 RepID=A0A927HR43_KLEPN|nr:hypothetical protein [Klebsiella pneumoniae]